MVIDKENGKSIPRYLVYDIVRFMGENYMPQTFDRRLDCIRKQVCGKIKDILYVLTYMHMARIVFHRYPFFLTFNYW